MVQVLKKELDLSFDEAVNKVIETVEEEFSVLMVKSIDDVIRDNLGLEDYPLKYTTILACGPQLAKSALDVSEDMGTLMPCSFSVYEKDGRVFVSHISIMKIGAELGVADSEAMEPVIAETGGKVEKVWEEL
ncbi:MAG: DUF302 domain-containing protein [Candidatus Bipolaricaulota bacterium]